MRPQFTRRSTIGLGWIAVVTPAVVVGIEGWTRRWVSDDAFIDFRVVHNIVHGHGPVFNVGERVEAYTDPLWVFILTCSRLVWFVPIEWSAVLLGLGFTVTGVVLAGRAAQRIGALNGELRVVPIGMGVVACVDGMWDFASSGLETGLIFGWLGFSWWSLVNAAERKGRFAPVALLIGLGPLIRPDLVLISACFVLALVAVAADPGDRRALARRSAGLMGIAAAVPLAYELWRMAYFALLVPNTALAKSAGSSWWSQGWSYLRDFVGPYWLWIPLLLLLPVLVRELHRVSRASERRWAAVLLAPVMGGLLSALYVVRVGGDFMHARMLLPAFFAVCMSLYCPVRWSVGMVLAAGAAAWGVVAATSLHYRSQGVNERSGISNERAFWVALAGTPNPVTSRDWTRDAHSFLITTGTTLLHAVDAAPPSGSGRILVLISGVQGQMDPNVVVDTRLRERVVAALGNIGLNGYVAGDQVFVVDGYGLANPVGSHFRLSSRGRPGHEKVTGTTWLIARFVPAGVPVPAVYLVPGQEIVDARAALQCGRLHSYLSSITRPLTVGLALSDIVHALGNTTLSFSSNPSVARAQLCGR